MGNQDKDTCAPRVRVTKSTIAVAVAVVIEVTLVIGFAVMRGSDPFVAMPLLYAALAWAVLAVGVAVELRIVSSRGIGGAKDAAPLAVALLAVAALALVGWLDVSGMRDGVTTRLTNGETSDPETTVLAAYDDGAFLHVKDSDTYTALTEDGKEVEIPVASSFTVDPALNEGRIETTETKVADETFAPTSLLSALVYGPEVVLGAQEAEPQVDTVVHVPELPMPDGFDEGFEPGLAAGTDAGDAE